MKFNQILIRLGFFSSVALAASEYGGCEKVRKTFSYINQDQCVENENGQVSKLSVTFMLILNNNIFLTNINNIINLIIYNNEIYIELLKIM